MNGNFDRALRHLAESSAITRLADYKESIREVVLQSVAVAEPFSLKSEKDVREAIDVFFGIPLQAAIVAEAIESLSSAEDRLHVSLGAQVEEA